MKSCCYGCLKNMVVIFNLLYMLLGLALLGTTLWIHLDKEYFSPVTDDVEGYQFILFFFMGVGSVMTIMGFLGCIGALQESQGMLATFFAMVLVLFAGQIAAGFWMYMNHDKFYNIIEKSITESIQRDYSVPGKESKTKAFDILQSQLKCCGSSGPQDWAKSRFNNHDPQTPVDIGVIGDTVLKAIGRHNVPDSCCNRDIPKAACQASRQVSTSLSALTSTIYHEGCTKKILSVLKTHNLVILIVVVTIFMVEILSMIFSMVLCCTVRRIDQFKA